MPLPNVGQMLGGAAFRSHVPLSQLPLSVRAKTYASWGGGISGAGAMAGAVAGMGAFGLAPAFTANANTPLDTRGMEGLAFALGSPAGRRAGLYQGAAIGALAGFSISQLGSRALMQPGATMASITKNITSRGKWGAIGAIAGGLIGGGLGVARMANMYQAGAAGGRIGATNEYLSGNTYAAIQKTNSLRNNISRLHRPIMGMGW